MNHEIGIGLERSIFDYRPGAKICRVRSDLMGFAMSLDHLPESRFVPLKQVVSALAERTYVANVVFWDTRQVLRVVYNANIGIQFRHELGKDVHAPGFYLHIATDECFFGAGCWHPEADMLGRIRDRIAENPRRWFAVRNDKKLAAHWTLAGDSLSRPPRGFSADHPAIDDLKRKDFIGLASLSAAEVTGSGLIKLAAERFAAAATLMKFLCEAQGVQY
jgi:uncharacterized protein (DUF2461 family)